MNKFKDKIKLNPLMTYIFLILFVICLSGFLSLIGFEATYNEVSTKGDFTKNLVSTTSLASLSGIKYIFSTTVSNFVAFTPLSMLIIVLIGIGIMEKSGFLKTAFTLLTKYSRKRNVTFVFVLICVLLSIAGDLAFVTMIPLGALLFYYGRRNPLIGIVTSFAALTCGSGLSLFFTAVDSAMLSSTINASHILDSGYGLGTLIFIFIMFVAIIVTSFIITIITEKYAVNRVAEYEFKEEKKDLRITKKEMRGLIIALIAGFVYLLIFAYNIIPGLPFSGKLLDYSQVFYIDKLFGFDSFFSNGFVFIVTVFFIILGLAYGLGAKTIRNNNDFCDDLSHSLDGTGNILIMILLASILINVMKKSNIGSVFAIQITSLISKTAFSGIPLVILTFFASFIITFLLPSPVAKWPIIAGAVVPVFMNAGLTPEFAQVIVRFSEGMAYGLTPLMAYFVIYLAYIQKYNQKEEPISLFTTIKYQLPYAIGTGLVLLVILIVWYISGLPMGLGGSISL